MKKSHAPEIDKYLGSLGDSGASVLTVKNYRSDLTSFDSWLTANYNYTKAKFQQIEFSSMIKEFADSLVDQGYSPATIERRLCAVRGFLEFLGLDGRFITDLVQHYKPKVESERIWLTTKQLNKYLREMDLMAREEEMAIALFILNTGLSVAELCQLTWADLSYVETPGGRKRRFTIKVGAGRRQRELPLTEAAAECLLAFGLGSIAPAFQKKQKQQIFQLNERPLTPKMVHYFMDRLTGPVGMAVTPQILRNTFCKRLADADVPLQHLAKMIGVKPEAARVYYAQPMASPEDMLAAAESVAI